MHTMKIHNVYENTHNYHVVWCNIDTGEVTTEKADYMALVTLDESNGGELVPMVLGEDGELQPCHPCSGIYAGIAKPGMDAVDIARRSYYLDTETIQLAKNNGMTQLIVGAE